MNGINHIAVWVAGIVHFMLGAGWYTVFSRAWLAGIGRTEAQLMAEQPNEMMHLLIAVVVAVVIAYAIAVLLPTLGAQTAIAGARTGGALALALIATTLAMNYAFEVRPLTLWLINAGYMVVGMAITGAIIGGWRKKA